MTLPIRPDPAHSVAVVLPLSQLDEHGAPVIVRRRGRQRRIERGCPTVSQELYEEAIARAAEQATEVDEVVVASQGNNPVELINKVVAAVASETAALRWERARAVREGRPNAEQISSRRVAALGRLADLLLMREHLRREEGDLDPAQLEQVVQLLVATVEEVIGDVAEPETADRFMASLRRRMTVANFPAATSCT